MEILPVLKPAGAIADLTETPVVFDLSQYKGGYVALRSTSDDDRFYVLPMASATPPGTIHTTTTVAEGADHTNVLVDDVADIRRGGPDGSSIAVKSSTPFLWIRTVTGTVTTHIKPNGRPGEAI